MRLRLIALLLLSTCASAQSTGTSIVMLGTGTPFADPDRFGPSVAIIVKGTPYIVDAGAGVVRRAAAAARGGSKALDVKNLHTLFLTHLHSDHTVGYPDFLLSPTVLDREGTVQVYGPKGTQEMTDHIYAAWKKDIDIRVDGLEGGNASGYKADVHEIKPGVVFKDGNVTVTAIPVKHGSWDESFGYRFQAADKTIVISGDTAYADSLVKACDGCDVLIHEVYCEAGLAKRTPHWQKYHSSFHTGAADLAKLANQAKPKLLVLYHQMFHGCSEQELLQEVRAGYKGAVVSAHDLDVY
jgi:ribonuclease BN (tRNA processing enzyme)